MSGRSTQLAAASLLCRSVALVLAWSLLLPPTPARSATPFGLSGSLEHHYEYAPDPRAAAALPQPEPPPPQAAAVDSDSLTGPCPQPPSSQEALSELAAGTLVHPHKPGDEWGEITVAQPKIWQFDRVSSLLDGLLRDVEGVSLSDLVQLNPNAQNAAAIRFVQSALEVGVQYDQAAALNAQNTLAAYQAAQSVNAQQLSGYSTYLQTLTAERNTLATQLAAANSQVVAIEAQITGTPTADQSAALTAAQNNVTSLTTALNNVNSLINAPPPTVTPPTLTGTSVATTPASGSSMSSSLMGFSDVLKNLPSGVQNNLSSALGSPTLPATKQLDNFITLLYERLAREVSVLQDDLTRDPENEAFLLQFDVGLYPSKRSSDHVARVEFDLNCPGCKIYSLYPGMSAYNIASYTGSSKRNTLWGNVLTLLGFGLSASYRREVDTLQGGLVQSVYVAGFQNGVLDTDKGYSRDKDAESARQSFGWYYGQAPTEKLVTPGIRTTFAMLTVPHRLIENTKNGWGNVDTCLALDIDGAWARRDNPTLQHAYFSTLGDAAKAFSFLGYYPDHHPLYNHNDEKSYVRKRASVRLPAAPDDVPLVAKREHQKLHVIRMEYNTVYAPPPSPTTPNPPASNTVSTSSSTTTTPSPSISTNVPTSGTTTTTTTTTTASSAQASPSTPPPPANPTYPNLNPLPCPEYECSAILIRLDRPIDPNLVVTANGIALQRVRDWRGRATSILPAAQSGSDLSSQAASTGSIFMRQLQDGRSLLESDKFEANAWFPLNSHDLLLNVSKSVAMSEEFPIVQISEPGGTVTVPNDLQTSTTELLINHFHIKPQTDASISETVMRNYASENDNSPPPRWTEKQTPLWSGPYAPTTFVPLFGAEPTAKKFYVQVGLTGEDLLIGFLPDPKRHPCGLDGKGPLPCSDYWSFSEAHTQVVLEDSELDFAWSLPCYVQDENLACHFPRHAILRAYQSYLQACAADPSRSCPALDERYKALRQAFGQLAEPVSASANQLKDRTTPEKLQQAERRARRQIAQENLAAILPRAFVPSTQLWVEQFDPEGSQRFYSAEPTKIDFLPLSDAFWHPLAKETHIDLQLPVIDSLGKITWNTQQISLSNLKDNLEPPPTALFNPWHFKSADSESVTAEGCNYTPDIEMAYKPAGGHQEVWEQHPQTQASVTMLGSGLPNVPRWLEPPPAHDAHSNPDTNCGIFVLPTPQLEKESIVFTLTLPPPSLVKELKEGDSSDLTSKIDVVMHLATSRLKPSFGPAQVLPNYAPSRATKEANVLRIDSWDVYLPASRLAPGDELEIPESLHTAGFDYSWPPVLTLNQPVPQPVAEGTSLHLQIKRAALPFLPDYLRLLRYWGPAPGIPTSVASIPNLQRLLVPTRLELIPIDDHQFVLKGQNAGLIDAVALSGGQKVKSSAVATSGAEFVLASFPSPPAKPADQNANSSSAAGTQNSSNITVVDSSASSKITINKQNKSTPGPKAQPPQPANNKPAAPTDTSQTPLDPGSYAVTPLIIVGYSIDDAKLAAAKKSVADAQSQANAAQTALNKNPSDQTAKTNVQKAQATLKKATNDAADAAKPTVPDYMPLDVTDEKGSPLIFVVPDTKKQSTTTPAPGSSTTCAAPCILTPCAATSCSQSATKPPSP